MGLLQLWFYAILIMGKALYKRNNKTFKCIINALRVIWSCDSILVLWMMMVVFTWWIISLFRFFHFVLIFSFYSYYITISSFCTFLFFFCFHFFMLDSKSLSISSFFCLFVMIKKIGTKYIKVVQEYERAVIFRLGRLMQGGAKGPGE